MAVYYKTIKGKRFDGRLIDEAEKSVAGRGDGRISIGDARKILRSVKDSSLYSDIEKKTIKYIRTHYSFTAEADQYFRTEIRKWAAAKGPRNAAKKGARRAEKPQKKAIPRKPLKKAAPHAPVRLVQKELPEETGTGGALRPGDAGTRPGREGAGKPSSPGFKKMIAGALIVLIAILVYLFVPGIKSRFSRDTGKSGGLDGRPEEKGKETVTLTEDPKGKTAVTPERPGAKDGADKSAGKEDRTKQKAAEPDGYTVVPGDSLIEISKKVYGDYEAWKRIYEANRGAIKDPVLIYPGQKIIIPKGDTKR